MVQKAFKSLPKPIENGMNKLQNDTFQEPSQKIIFWYFGGTSATPPLSGSNEFHCQRNYGQKSLSSSDVRIRILIDSVYYIVMQKQRRIEELMFCCLSVLTALFKQMSDV